MGMSAASKDGSCSNSLKWDPSKCDQGTLAALPYDHQGAANKGNEQTQ